ncbi:molybdopterin-guanine dinucleotide biosynthesis protein [Paramagnetospirillum caucaseum]|uniref:Molybdopterin-guanine dinucleotide biosynthesis protein n=1 Tax=Paramagnetospirillum caucaseum TaxID=1244869 RepID=M2ZR84_9PROT|nr:molybdopterin-guanine dinucleotide biosynthesis protein B [Paramagnetospirillum caucaseum]EME69837.1 molybdopterin-guanine dinucleotide biosynthesis protein [Paramagnetospirillum caucaseum]
MKVFGIAGWSGSGKTTLLTRLIPALVQAGIRVATVKHTHHDPAVGDEECRALARAGAMECVVASPRRFALVHEIHLDDAEPPLDWLMGRFAGIDLLLIEGYKWASHPKLEVWNPSLGKSMLAPAESSIVALASDQPVATVALPQFHRDDIAGIAAYICQYCRI